MGAHTAQRQAARLGSGLTPEPRVPQGLSRLLRAVAHDFLLPPAVPSPSPPSSNPKRSAGGPTGPALQPPGGSCAGTSRALEGHGKPIFELAAAAMEPGPWRGAAVPDPLPRSQRRASLLFLSGQRTPPEDPCPSRGPAPKPDRWPGPAGSIAQLPAGPRMPRGKATRGPDPGVSHVSATRRGAPGGPVLPLRAV